MRLGLEGLGHGDLGTGGIDVVDVEGTVGEEEELDVGDGAELVNALAGEEDVVARLEREGLDSPFISPLPVPLDEETFVGAVEVLG